MPLLQLGASPIPVDVDAWGALDLDQAAALLTPRTRALVVIHMWGHPQDMLRLRGFCDRHSIDLIEDCAHAHGAASDGISVGQLADAACWSLQGRKTITAGEGGILTTPHRGAYDRAQLLGHFNMRALGEIDPASPCYRHAETGLGVKYRAHPLGLAMAEVYLGRLDEWLAHRRRHAAALESVLTGHSGITVLTLTGQDHTSTFYAFVFTIDPAAVRFSRDDLLREIRAAGCDAVGDCNAMRPLHTYPALLDPRSPVIGYEQPLIRTHHPEASRLAEHSLRVAVPANDTDQANRYTRVVADAIETALVKLA